jgi:hypothetical protein
VLFVNVKKTYYTDDGWGRESFHGFAHGDHHFSETMEATTGSLFVKGNIILFKELTTKLSMR